MSLIAKRVVDVVLTKIAMGFKNAEMVATQILPLVLVSKMGVKIPLYGKEAFRIYNTKRAPGADSNQLKLDPKDTIDAVLSEDDISVPIDHLEKSESVFDETVDAAETGSDVLDLGLEKEVADMLTDPANYPATNKVALTTSHDEEGATIVEDVETGKGTVRKMIGRRPNMLLLGPTTFDIYKNSPELIGRIKYAVKGVLTKELLAQIFGVKKVIVGEAVYEDGDGEMKDVWPDIALLAYVPEKTKSYRTPSNGFILRKKGYRQIDKYPSVGGKVLNVRNTDVKTAKITIPEAMYLITNTKAA